MPPQTARYNSVGIVDVTDKYVAMTALYDRRRLPYPNALHVFSASYGELLHTLASSPHAGNLNYNFGSSIAIDGDLAVVSASREHLTRADGTIAYNAGAAHVYDLASGQLLHKLGQTLPALTTTSDLAWRFTATWRQSEPRGACFFSTRRRGGRWREAMRLRIAFLKRFARAWRSAILPY